MVRDWLGDGDPKAISLVAGAAALGVSKNQVGRARDVIVRERLDAAEAPKLALVAKPAPPTERPRAEKLFWVVEGNRLCCRNREPMEVGW
jgi:hypothetical protein